MSNKSIIFRNFFSLIILSFTLISCSQIVDNYLEERDRDRYTSPFMGKWVGTYNGDESGNLTIEIAKSGIVSGSYGADEWSTVASNVYDTGELMPPNTNNARTILLYGNLNKKTGTWKKKDQQGTWTLAKVIH